MKRLFAIPLTLSLSASIGAAEQVPPDTSNLGMRVTGDGKVELFEASEEAPEVLRTREYRLVLDPELTAAAGDEPIYRLANQDPERPGSAITLPNHEGDDPQVIFYPSGYRYAPGSQGSVLPGQQLSEEEQRTIVGALVEYASMQAIAAADAFCSSQSAMRPESVSITAGGTPLQVSVTWSVDQACEAGQAED